MPGIDDYIAGARDAAKVCLNIKLVGKCWIWKKAINGHGYGWLAFRQKTWASHWVTLKVFKGVERPKGMEVDHLCRVRACCNPDHLEVVTPEENRKRGLKYRFKTHCRKGHRYTQENTLRYKNQGRRCKICTQKRWQMEKRRKCL